MQDNDLFLLDVLDGQDAADLNAFSVGLAREYGDDVLLGEALRDAVVLGARVSQMCAWTELDALEVLELIAR